MGIVVKWNGKKVKGIGDTKPIVDAMRTAMFREFRLHFTAKDAEGNKNGWWRSHFWYHKVSQKMSLGSLTPTRGEIDIASPPFGHKIRGGEVKPVQAKALAIPLTSAAKKLTRPGLVKGNKDFQYVPIKKGKMVGMIFKVTGKKKKKRTPFWVLLTSVFHKPDPTAEPDQEAVNAAVNKAANSAYLRAFRRANGMRR